MRPRRIVFWASIVTPVLLALLVSGLADRFQAAARAQTAPEGGRAAPAAQGQEGRLRAEDLAEPFKRAARMVRPSVVSIASVKIVRGMPGGGDLGESPFRDFGGDDFERFFRRSAPQESQKQTGVGTGIIVSAEGHILTNNHVVAGASQVMVKQGDRENQARVIGTDPLSDLAVIKIDATDLTPARLGDSDKIEQGDWVLAMGSPFELSETLTAGIVSAKGRANLNIVEYGDFIQTDAAINPGNSGGPLFDLHGEVVGINTAIFSRSGGSMGIGFAIPSSMARGVMESILKEGRVVRGFLGIGVQPLTANLARTFGYEGKEGALVTQVVADGPAARAGLKEGDIITRLIGTPVKDALDLKNRVATLRPGTKAELEVVREGRPRTLTVEVAELPQERTAQPQREQNTHLGMAVRTLTPELAHELEQDESLAGVLVTAVEPGSPADRAGFLPRDIVLEVNGKLVRDLASFRSELEKQDPKKGVRLKIRRGLANLFVYLEDKG